MSSELLRLQAIFLGETPPVYAGAVETVSDPIPRSLPDRPTCGVSFGEDGILIVGEAGLSKSRMDLELWSGRTVFANDRVIFIPWVDVRDLLVREGEQAIVFDHGTDRMTRISLPLGALSELVAIFQSVTGLAPNNLHPDAGGDSPPEADEDPALVLEDLVKDVQAVLLDRGFADEALIRADLIERHGWEDVETDELDAILWSPDAQTQYVPHLWFYDDDNALDHTDLPDLTQAVLALLEAAPRQATEILDTLIEQGHDDVVLEDVYDVLYQPDLPTYKCVRAWCSTATTDD